MAHEFRLEDPGEGLHEAEILEIPVSKGDEVAEGDTVVVIETDKAAMEIPAPVGGEVQEIRIAVGDTAEVGDVLMVFGEAGEGGDTEEQDDDSGTTEEADGADDEGAEAPADDAEEEDGESDPGEKEDSDKTDDSGEKTGSDERAEKPSETDGSPAGQKPQATPAVRGLAREMGVDLSNVEGSGDGGRILKDDVKAVADGGGKETTDETVVELRSLRRTTARRMAEAWREIPHVTHQDVIEITALERLRREHEDDIEKRGGSLTLTPFIVKALAIALADFPNFNATFDAESEAVHQLSACNIGVALDTERGLLVPVLHDAARKSIADLALELTHLGERLRDGSATREDLRGATFTLTNIGAIGGTGLAPLINPPQTAIFGAARAALQQVVRGDIDEPTTEVALCLPVSLTFDHRVADGAEAARFVERVKALLDDPGALVLNS